MKTQFVVNDIVKIKKPTTMLGTSNNVHQIIQKNDNNTYTTNTGFLLNGDDLDFWTPSVGEVIVMYDNLSRYWLAKFVQIEIDINGKICFEGIDTQYEDGVYSKYVLPFDSEIIKNTFNIRKF